jgi:hypothetical protein
MGIAKFGDMKRAWTWRLLVLGVVEGMWAFACDDSTPEPQFVQAHGDAAADGPEPGQPDGIDATDPDEDSEASRDEAELVTCTADPAVENSWCPQDAAACGDHAHSTCALPWGCDAFETARASAIENCEAGSVPFVARGCGYRIIQERKYLGIGWTAFYSEDTGALVGTWSRNGIGEEYCSGDIPVECIAAEPSNLDDVQPLCEQTIDGGACLLLDDDPNVAVCSSSATVTWDNYGSCSTGCPLWWGCEPFEASQLVISECDDAGFNPKVGSSAKGCGYLILRGIHRDPSYGFYDETTGELVAAWAADDSTGLRCSGPVPMDCLWEGPLDSPITDIVDLCADHEVVAEDASTHD